MDEDPQPFRETAEKLMLAKLDESVEVECDDTAGDSCHQPAEWSGRCNTCRAVFLVCGDHHASYLDAATRFNLFLMCGGCRTARPFKTAFKFEPLRSPS